MGAAAALLPAFIPSSSERFGLTDFSLLTAVPLMFGGLFFGVVLAPLLNLRLRLDLVIRFATALLSLGLVGLLLAASPQLFFAASALLGLGFGALEVSITAAVKASGTDTTRDLTKLNLVFAASAMAAPLLLLLELSLFGSAYLLLLTAVLAVVPSFGIAALTSTQGRAKLAGGVKLLPLLLAALLYVGAESVLAGWSSTLVEALLDLRPEQAAIGASAFWALIALGRWASLVVTPRFLGPRAAAIFWAAAAAGALLSAALLPLGPATLALFAVAIFAAGPLYALLIARVLELVPSQSASSTTAAVIVVGAAGGFLIPAVLQLNPGIAQAAWLAGLSFLLVSALATFTLRTKASELQEVLA